MKPIQKNEPAPDFGYYMPKDSYQQLLNQALKNQVNQNQLDECLSIKPPEPDESHEYEWALTGFVLGFVSTAALVYYLK